MLKDTKGKVQDWTLPLGLELLLPTAPHHLLNSTCSVCSQLTIAFQIHEL